jgi:hypothetical protein
MSFDLLAVDLLAFDLLAFDQSSATLSRKTSKKAFLMRVTLWQMRGNTDSSNRSSEEAQISMTSTKDIY